MEVEPFGVETWGSHVKRTPPLSFPPTVNIKAVQLVYLLMIKIVYIYIFLPIYTRTHTKESAFLFIQYLSISGNTQLLRQLGMNNPLVSFFQLNDVILCQGKAQFSESHT